MSVRQQKTLNALRALLEGRTINRKDWNNASLHSWVSTIRNRWFIPVESKKSNDRTSDYFMLPAEIMRYKNPVLRKEQRQEMQEYVLERRQQAKKKYWAVNAPIKPDDTLTQSQKISLRAATLQPIGDNTDE